MRFNILEVRQNDKGQTELRLGTALKSMWVLFNQPASGHKACEPAGFVGPEVIQGAITGKLSVATDKSTGGPCSINPYPFRIYPDFALGPGCISWDLFRRDLDCSSCGARSAALCAHRSCAFTGRAGARNLEINVL